MGLKLKHKLLILIFIPLIISFILISMIYNNHITAHFETMAIKDNTHRLQVFNDKIKNLQTALQNFAHKVANDENIISSLNLIVNYEDKNDYKYLVFDQEKRKLIKKYDTFTTNAYDFSVTYYNIQKELITHSKISKNDPFTAIASYDSQGNTLYLNSNNKIITLNQNILSLDYSQSMLYITNGIFYIQNITPIFKNDKIIAHVKTILEIDNESFLNLISDFEQGFSLMSKQTTFSNKMRANNISFEAVEQSINNAIDTPTHYYNFKPLCEHRYEDNVYIVSGFSKDALQNDLNTIIYQVTSILALVYIGLLLLIQVFTSKYIIRPLNTLLKSIKSLHSKEYQLINVESDDELGQISKSFNELSLELQNSITKLQSSNILLQNILDSVPMRIFIKDIHSRYIKANRYFLNDLGLKNESEILGKTDDELSLLHSNKITAAQEDDEVIFKSKIVFKKETTLTKANGSSAEVILSKIALKNQNDEVVGLLGIYEDVTEQKEVKKQLFEKEKHLLHQSRLAQMGEMISMIAHQWRQPLSAISSTASALSLKVAMGKYDEEFFQSRLDNINTYSQHLSTTIDDFRNFFKKHKEKRKITLEKLIDDSLNIIETSMKNKSIEIKKDYNCFMEIETYPNEVRQVILNLLKNAEDVLSDLEIENKWVKITTEYQDQKNVIKIEDNGGGINENVLDKIFEPYFSTKDNKDGTGLGLYMSRTIIQEHCNGKLSVYNSKDGAVFKVEL